MSDRPAFVRDLMTPEPLTRPADATVDELSAAMSDNSIRHVPIVEGDRLVGIVSSKDLHRDGSIAADVMTRTPVTVHPDERLEVAAATMAVRKISAVLVVGSDQRLVGILTTYDLLDAFAHRLREGQ